MNEFRLNHDAETGGTHLVGEICVSPTKLIARFGPPKEGDDHKVSGEYTFVDSMSGAVFSLYDYKYTCLYECDFPTPETVWFDDQIDLSVGGRTGPTEFIDWLHDQLEAEVPPKVAQANLQAAREQLADSYLGWLWRQGFDFGLYSAAFRESDNVVESRAESIAMAKEMRRPAKEASAC